MTEPKFHKSIDPIEQSSEYIFGLLKQHLQNNERVLWIVPGGSAIAVVVIVGSKLKGIDCKRLTISMTDERYGEVDHPNSSWFQLSKAGFGVEGAHLHPILEGKSKEDTAQDYNKFLEESTCNSDFVLGFFGIGADGHTAGLLPGSKAVDAESLVLGYQGDKFYRVTTTPKVINFMDEVVVYAVGEEKKNTLEKLKETIPLDEQPAQTLKQAGRLDIFTQL